MPMWGSPASLLAPTAPSSATSDDKGAVSLGTRMSTQVRGRVVAVRWFCPAGWDGSAGEAYASVYSASGVLLAQIPFTPVPGWNRVPLPTPVEMEAGSSWTAAVWLPARPSGGDYGFHADLFAAPVISGDLTGTAGAFDYSINALYPSNVTSTWFGVDVEWQPLLSESAIPAGWPTELTTGPAAGTALADYAGPTVITPGVYTAIRFPELPPGGFYESSADDLVFHDCEFESGLVLRGDRLAMLRCRVAGGLSLSGVDTATLARLDLHHSGTDLLHITSDTGTCRNIGISESVLRSPVPVADAHADGIQVRGVRGLTLSRCAIDMGPWAQVAGKDVLNSAVFLQNAQGGCADVRIEDCYLNGGGYALVADVVFGAFVLTGNRWGVDWQYGPVSMTGGVPTLLRDNRFYSTSQLVFPDTLGADDLTISWGPMRAGWRFDPAKV